MGALTPSKLVALKAAVKAECQRRAYVGSVADYGGSAYDYTNVPATGTVVRTEHYSKIAVPINAINGSVDVNASRVVSESEIDVLQSTINNLGTASMVAETLEGTGCNASCTGLCFSTCTGGCSSCTGTCQGTCQGCTNCTGTCVAVCSNNCTTGCRGCDGSCDGCDGCDGCGGACEYSCSGGCSDSCFGSCDDGCQHGCYDACTGCGGDCVASCSTGCGHMD